MVQVKLAVYGAGGCSGCEVSLLEDPAGFMELAVYTRVSFWPLLTNSRLAGLKGQPDGSVDLAILCGSLRTELDLEVAELMRRKSRYLLAAGSCALWGGVPALADLPPGFRGPPADPSVPPLLSRVLPVREAVRVDEEVPGCPPLPGQLLSKILEIAGLREPASPGMEENTALCLTCPRKSEQRSFARWLRPPEVLPAEGCFLNRGLACSGPATRGGCGARCPAAGQPCRGCYGPLPGVTDQGARLLGALGEVLDPGGPEGEQPATGAVDLAGTFYRYTLAGTTAARVPGKDEGR